MMVAVKSRPAFTCQPVAVQPYNGGRADPRRTALREAAYVRRSRFTKGNTVLHDFSSRAEDLFMLATIIPLDAGEWAHRPFLRWRLADEAADAEGKDTAIRAWHICGDLKKGLSKGEWMDQAEGLVRSALAGSAIAEIAGHIPPDKPPHVHILVAARRAGESSYEEINFGIYKRLNVDLRLKWERWLEKFKKGGLETRCR